VKKTSFYFLTLWGLLWLQVVINHFAGGSAFTVNVILISVLAVGLSRGPAAGLGVGYVWGLLLDASSLGLLGMHALLYGLAGYTAGLLRRQLDETKIWTQAIFSFAITVLYLLAYVGLGHLFSTGDRSFSWRLVVEPVVNALLAPLFFGALRQWFKAWDLFTGEA
jgi:rod shape-determining protein MreD